MTKFWMTALTLSLTLSLAGCKDKEGDSADSAEGDTDTDTDSDTDTDTDTDIDSCDWPDVGLCFEWTGYADASQWCTDIGAQENVTTEFFAGEGCPSDGVVGDCDIAADADTTDDHSYDVTAYYYSPFTADSAADACEGAGGSR